MAEFAESSSGELQADRLDTTLPGEVADGLAGTPRRTGEDPLPRGAHVGRYTVLERIGSGGMGVVYAAFDPQLNRRVALKVMHAGGSGAKDFRGRARLLREAQAMARLSHPNVITVHDVGTYQERVFVAMEFIEGSTLREWPDNERDWPKVTDTYVRAGRGLAAAHAAGLVHRDFKPDNVLLGVDGRVLVMDFGLARQAATHAPTLADRLQEVAHAQPTAEMPDLNLTRTGAMLGTPAYMAPEQHRGESIGPHADQFSFCVALYEGLYRERPFDGCSMTSLAMNVLDGRVRDPPRETRVPQWLREVVLRGLSVDPVDRFPSMDALLAELQRDPPVNHHPWLVAGLTLGVGSLITGVYLSTRTNRLKDCTAANRRARDLWSGARKAALAERFAQAGPRYAATSWQSMAQDLDRYEETWTRVHGIRCTADAKLRAHQAPNLDDPGLLCLDDRVRELEVLLTHLEATPALESVARHGVEAVQSLPSPADCTAMRRHDSEDLRVAAGRARRDELDALHGELSLGRVLAALGAADEAHEVFAGAQSHAADARAPSLHAEAILLGARANLLRGRPSAAEAGLEDAILAAARAGRPDLEADAWTLATRVVAIHQGRYHEGRRLALAAEAALVRAGDDPMARARLRTVLGAIAQAEGAFDSALRHFDRALTIVSDRAVANDLRLAEIHSWIGAALDGASRHRRAANHHRTSLMIREERLGASHPDIARSLVQLAAGMRELDQLEAAEGTLARARLLLDPHSRVELGAPADAGAHPADSAQAQLRDQLDDPLALAQWFDELGRLRRAQGDFAQAARLHARAAAMLERVRGPMSRKVGYAWINLGLALADQRRHSEALAHLRRGLHVWTQTLPPTHPDLGVAHLNLANSLWATGQLELAREHFARAKAAWEHPPDDDPRLSYALAGLGRTLLDLGQPQPAVAHLERAYQLRGRDTEDPLNRAEASLLLGRALHRTGRDPEYARELVIHARDAVGAYEPGDGHEIYAALVGGDHAGFTDRLSPAGVGVSDHFHPHSSANRFDSTR